MKPRMLLTLAVAVLVATFGLPAAGPGSSKAEAASLAATTGSGVGYTYDALGRLKTVTDPAGAQATYNYDAVGNLLSITRSTAPAAPAMAASSVAAPQPVGPSISSVQPATASSGDHVTITGSGFSSEPLENSVRIGKVAATVVSASPTSLDVLAPPGDADGQVRVKTPGGGATSTQAVKVSSTTNEEKPTNAAKRQSSRPLPTGPKGGTALSGQVIKLDGSPLAEVTVSIGKATALTDQAGQFLLKAGAPGKQKLVIDGASVAGPDRYGLYEAGVTLAAGKTTQLPFDVWMPVQDTTHSVSFPSPTTQEVVVTNPDLPGAEVHIPAGTKITDRAGKPVTQLTLTPLPSDRTPIPLAPGMPLYFDLQPGGATADGPGMQVVYPNITNHPVGTTLAFVTHDADGPGMGWRSYGSGTVKAEGNIVPDDHTRLYKTSGFSVIYNPLCPDPDCPHPGEDSKDGDPVNLSTGLFVMDKTDLVLPDVIPVSLGRTYRQNFQVLQTFGIGQSDGYGYFIAPDSSGNYSMGMPDGGKVAFTPGADGIYRASSTPTQFAGAVLTRASYYDFTVKLRDGTVFTMGGKTATLIAITDRFGNKLTIARAPYGQIQRITAPNGRWLAFTWGTCTGTSQCVTKVTDNIGRSTSYAYDTSGRLTAVTDAAGKTTRYAWAPCAGSTCTQLLSITDPTNTTFLTNRFDANGRVDLQTQADGTTYQFAYTLDAAGTVTKTTVTDPRGIVRAVTFSPTGFMTSETAAVGKPEQQTATITRDAANFATKSVDPLGRATTFTYDAAGNVLSVTRVSGTTSAATTSFTYEPAFNRIATTTDPLNRVTKFAYDDAAQTVTVTDPLGQASVTTLQEGQPIMAKDALGNRTDMSYLYGDLVAVADPLGRVATRYVDDGGRLVRVTDPMGNYTQLAYDRLNQVTSATDAMGGVTRFSYDANGNRLSVTDAKGQATTFAYDKLDRPTTRTDPLARAESVAYDAAGNTITATDRNGTITRYTYDALGRRLTSTFGSTATGSESTIARTYDAGNRLTKAVDSKAGTISRAYDTLDRMTSEATPQGTLSYTYDKADHRLTMTVAGQAQVAYAYDNNDRLTSITQGTSVARYAYDSIDRPTSLTLPNGLVQKYSYDAASQLGSITYQSGTTNIGDLTYTYDTAGRRTSVGGAFARTGLPDALASATYNANNEITNFGGKTPTYDQEGRLKNDGTNTYSWNARGELASIAGGATASFTYDAFGRRTQKTIAATSTAFLYDGANIVQELSGTTPTANLLTGLGVDETLTRTDSAGTRQLLTDALGSTVALTDNAGTVPTQYTYEPFGKPTTTGATTANPVQHTGRENDGTGLQYSRARYYSPTLQRFISQDPLGFAGGDTNLSGYVGNSPTNLTDPTGLYWGESVVNGLATVGRKLLHDSGVRMIIAGFGAGLICASTAGLGCFVIAGALIGAGLGAADYGINSSEHTAGGWMTHIAVGGVEGGIAGLTEGLARGADVPCNSFTGDTAVLMADGSQKPIRDVRLGDLVQATDPQTGETTARPVTDVIVHGGEHTMVALTLADGSTLTATDRHPFWNADSAQYTDAIDVRPGTHLLGSDGARRTVTAVKSHVESLSAYNLTVDGVHTYYVGTDPVLVHNASCNQMNQEIQRGNAPRGVERVDSADPNIPGSQDHVHFDGERSTLNRDGTWGHGGEPLNLSNKIQQWLRGNGFNI